jgi:hypothetical protein
MVRFGLHSGLLGQPLFAAAKPRHFYNKKSPTPRHLIPKQFRNSLNWHLRLLALLTTIDQQQLIGATLWRLWRAALQ